MSLKSEKQPSRQAKCVFCGLTSLTPNPNELCHARMRLRPLTREVVFVYKYKVSCFRLLQHFIKNRVLSKTSRQQY